MSMFCYQCQEAAKGVACEAAKGVCGISPETIRMQDLSVYLLKGLAVKMQEAKKAGIEVRNCEQLMMKILFTTVTNVSFTVENSANQVKQVLDNRLKLETQLKEKGVELSNLHDSAVWFGSESEYEAKAIEVTGRIDAPDADTLSLRSLVLYGLKGLAAYADHATELGFEDEDIYAFTTRALASLTDDTMTADENTALVLETGKYGVNVMALLDKANTTTYGHPEMSTVQLGVQKNPGILITGHDLKDIEELLQQTEGTGVDVYTHSEMLPAHYYPELKKYKHLVGNYGGAWWSQKDDFTNFNGPILFTTNCIVPPSKNSVYKDKVYTTGNVAFDGFKPVADRQEGGQKDFSEIIELAKSCEAPKEMETGTIVGGFAHNQVFQLADKVVDAVKTGAIKKFFVMAGCDGRMKSREYYTDFAGKLPDDTVILTAGCAKFRYNKLGLGDIGGIPRVLDAGQCNDSYSLAVIALKLKEVFELNDINELPIAYNIAWYEQKAVIVLLALLHLGVKNIKLGPTLPAFLSSNVADILVNTFGINGINTPDEDIKQFLGEPNA